MKKIVALSLVFVVSAPVLAADPGIGGFLADVAEEAKAEPFGGKDLCRNYLGLTLAERSKRIQKQFRSAVKELAKGERKQANRALIAAMESLRPGVIEQCLALPTGASELPAEAQAAWNGAIVKVLSDFFEPAPTEE